MNYLQLIKFTLQQLSKRAGIDGKLLIAILIIKIN